MKKNKADNNIEKDTNAPGNVREDSPEPDLSSVYDQIVEYEKDEPDEGFEPAPWWVWAISILVLFVMGFYLGKYSGTFGTVAHEVEMPPQVVEERAVREIRGDQLYAGLCQPCHGSEGAGIAGRYPPLAGSEWVSGDADIPALIVLFGLEGPIEVMGNVYNERMDPFAHRLNNREIAAVVNFIRSSWGNDAPEIDPDRVSELRDDYAGRGLWRADELQALRESRE